MGVKIGELVEARSISLDELEGRTILFDAFNMLYQFLSSIRAADGTLLKTPDGRITSHLVGLVNRLVVFLEHHVLPVLVFDGESPALKAAERERRAEVKAEAAEKLREALEKGDEEAIRKYASRTAVLNEDMIADAKRVLRVMGIPFLDAPSEAEAEAAFLVRRDAGWAVGSEDYDSLLFGAPRVVRHLAVSGQRRYGVVLEPEVILLEDVLKRWGISYDDLIVIGILIGTDFNPGGVRGIGPKRAVELVKTYSPDYDALFSSVDWSFSFSWREVFEIFKNPPVVTAGPFRLDRFDREAFMRLLVEEYAFSRDRVERLADRIVHARRAGRQQSLASFLKR